MRTLLACTMLVAVAGCGWPSVPVISAERIADGHAQTLGLREWNEAQYAPGQYAGFVFDSTGVYGKLRGKNAPLVIAMSFVACQDDKLVAQRDFSVSEIAFRPSPPDVAERERLLLDPRFKWLTAPGTAADPMVYERIFWLPWEALGLSGAPSDEKMHIWVNAMQRTGTGAVFHFPAKPTP